MMQSLVEYQNECAGQSARLESHEAELNRVETSLMASAKSGTSPPSSFRVFRALSDASIVCAEVIDEYAGGVMPSAVRRDLSRVHCAMTDLGVTLASYTALALQKASARG